MSASPRAVRRPPACDVIVEEDPHAPLPPRRVALQALAATMPVQRRPARYLPLAAAGLALSAGWFMAPDDAPFARLILFACSLAYAGATVWSLRPAHAAPRARGRTRPSRAADLPHDFECFMEDGIAASRRRGRTAALLRFGFVLPGHSTRVRAQGIDAIGETARDVTRAYDFVHVPGDGSILVFIAHLPCDMPVATIARRIVDDLELTCGPAATAQRVELQMATLGADEEMRGFADRIAREPVVVMPRPARHAAQNQPLRRK